MKTTARNFLDVAIWFLFVEFVIELVKVFCVN